MTSMIFSGEFVAIAMAAINSIANLGGFVGPVGIGALRAATGSNQYGFYLIAGFLIASTLITLGLKQVNQRKEIPVESKI